MTKDHEPIARRLTEFDLLSDSDTAFSPLSEEERKHIELVGEIVERYVKAHPIADDKVDTEYGILFDRFFEKSTSELTILKALFDV